MYPSIVQWVEEQGLGDVFKVASVPNIGERIPGIRELSDIEACLLAVTFDSVMKSRERKKMEVKEKLQREIDSKYDHTWFLRNSKVNVDALKYYIMDRFSVTPVNIIEMKKDEKNGKFMVRLETFENRSLRKRTFVIDFKNRKISLS